MNTDELSVCICVHLCSTIKLNLLRNKASYQKGQYTDRLVMRRKLGRTRDGYTHLRRMQCYSSVPFLSKTKQQC